MRVDQLLVSRGLAPTRSAAQRLILGGAVRWRAAGDGWRRPRKPGEALAENCEIEITDDAELRYVSRGGLKLEHALAVGDIDVREKICLDLGQSTGGFTDCLLQAGAARVVGVDVGHGQLHPRLRDDPRVTAFEGLNVRALGLTPRSGDAAGIAPRSRVLAPPATQLVSPALATRVGSEFAASAPPEGFALVVAGSALTARFLRRFT